MLLLLLLLLLMMMMMNGQRSSCTSNTTHGVTDARVSGGRLSSIDCHPTDW